ncbi:uncharacterized protein LOC127834934 [Dreissena polymorpha]|uniref:THD domain-containing protein n=1 Tax=Dreissena polymorpha TaxID=45954 RepID=A0A9D4JNZ0_DREPO|nr:uncharacterized protein LOC127834934 [Dreissena polymorpha]KAH3814522.1 hypothetical protein DPMN_143024 [Dreissena polymorpha]
MALDVRTEFIVKHPFVIICGCLFLILVSIAIGNCSWTYTKHMDEHYRMKLFPEEKLKLTSVSNLLNEGMSHVYTEVATRNNLFVTEYLNNHVQVKEFFLDRLTDRKPAAKLVGSTRCVQKDDQIHFLGKVLFGANNDGPQPSVGFLRNDVISQNDRLIVPLTGTYRMYSSFHHRFNCSLPERQTNADEVPLVRHAMYRFNIRLGHDQEVASTNQDHIYCKCTAFVDFQTEISTLVELLAGDEISVKLNDCSLLIHSEANYFGLSLI